MVWGTVKSFLEAATSYLKVLPLLHTSKLYKQIHKIDDEIYILGLSGSPDDKLRIEQLAKRKARILEQIRAIRPANRDPD